MGSYLGLSYTLTNTIVAGQTYSFRIRARNKWGWSEFSTPPLQVLAAFVPYRVDLPATSIDVLSGGVKVAWLAPYENGATISAYYIEIKDQSGNWQTTPECDGSTAQVINALSCVVSMDTLSLSYGLAFNEIVIVRISAQNIMGQGAWSQSNTSGAKLRQRPTKMTQVSKNSQLSTETSLLIQWQALTSTVDTGNSAILAYEVYWDAATGITNILLHDSVALTS